MARQMQHTTLKDQLRALKFFTQHVGAETSLGQITPRDAEVEYVTPHDLRRSCITNWARLLPIQTVQHLAGHSSITTTREYYLAVLEADCTAAREIQSEIMTSLTNFWTNSFSLVPPETSDFLCLISSISLTEA
jgi:integrase